MRELRIPESILLLAWAALPLQAQAPAENSARQLIADFQQQQTTVKPVSDVALSPDGLQVTWTISQTWTAKAQLFIAPVNAPQQVRALQPATTCNSQAAAWAPNGHDIAFFSDCATPGQLQVFAADTAQAAVPPRQLTHVKGYVSHLAWSPDGRAITLLYVESASREPSPMAPVNKAVGVMDDRQDTDVQRIALVDPQSGDTRQVTPAGLYVFEYDWSPDAKSFAYLGAPPPGDDNWYIAKLYTQPAATAQPVVVYQPKLQLALPRWSPDGKRIAFIEGLMSDEGATGGEIYVVPATGGQPRDLTPARPSTPGWFSWLTNDEMLFTEYVGGSIVANTLQTGSGDIAKVWQGGETIQAGPEAASMSVAKAKGAWTAAFSRLSWDRLPEVWAGPIGSLKQMTQLNTNVTLALPRPESITWKSGEFPVQGWLLYPAHYDPSKKYPLLVSVHGGPAWIAQPSWEAPDFNTTVFTQLGYFVLFPNVRGSFGQGEKFTQANRREWGFGDLQDMVAGVDAVVKQFPVDSDRVGVLGWSYGGSTSMMAVTRTHRFRAAVAGAGASNLQSYYGQNAIDKWMIPYFGASVYDDPAAYLRCSALTYVKNAKTPTLIVVGEFDGEAPPVQSIELWHAFKELGVPTQLVIYADEGHSFFKAADRTDLTFRAYEWFEKYMAPR